MIHEAYIVFCTEVLQMNGVFMNECPSMGRQPHTNRKKNATHMYIGGLGGESFSSPNREMLCKRRDASKKGIAGNRPVGSD